MMMNRWPNARFWLVRLWRFLLRAVCAIDSHDIAFSQVTGYCQRCGQYCSRTKVLPVRPANNAPPPLPRKRMRKLPAKYRWRGSAR